MDVNTGQIQLFDSGSSLSILTKGDSLKYYLAVPCQQFQKQLILLHPASVKVLQISSLGSDKDASGVGSAGSPKHSD